MAQVIFKRFKTDNEALSKEIKDGSFIVTGEGSCYVDYEDKRIEIGNKGISDVLNTILPVGKVEVFFDNEDHSNYAGFTWERTSIGRVPVGIDESQSEFNEIGRTGGSKSLQAHTHTFTTNPTGAHNHSVPNIATGGTGSSAYAETWGAGSGGRSFYTDSVGNHTHSGTTNSTGEGASGNLQPYEVMAFWKRIA